MSGGTEPTAPPARPPGTDGPSLLPVLQDRRCRPGALSNPVRRWLAPAVRDVDRLGLWPGATVVDLGAGVGFHAEELLRRLGPSGSLLLVDADPENLERARRRLGTDPRLRFRSASAARIPEVPDASVDRALLSLVLCCLVDKAGAMDELWRVLRPGGRALVTYPRPYPGRSRSRRLRMTAPLWSALVARRPWTIVDSHTGWLIARHLLERPRGDGPEPLPPPPEGGRDSRSVGRGVS